MQLIIIRLNGLFYFAECECSNTGSETHTCDTTTGQCNCNTGYYGRRCRGGNNDEHSVGRYSQTWISGTFPSQEKVPLIEGFHLFKTSISGTCSTYRGIYHTFGVGKSNIPALLPK